MEESAALSAESTIPWSTELPLARIGVPEDFDTFFARELPRLVALATALCGRAIAEDLAQDAMLAAYRRWDSISTYEKPEAWVRHVCVNAATSQLRRRAVEARGLLRLGGRRAQLPIPEPDVGFWSAVRALPRRQAQAAALRYVYDLSVVDVAAAMGCSEGTAKVHLSRARAALTRSFQDDLGAES